MSINWKTSLIKAAAVTRINFRFRNLMGAYIPIICGLGLFVGQDIVNIVLYLNGEGWEGNESISPGNALFFFVALCGLLIGGRNFRRIAHLGGKRADYYIGCIYGYALLAAACSLINMAFHYLYDPIFSGGGFGYEAMYNLADVWGWAAHGPIILFLRQFAFMLIVAAFAHTLASLHDSWAGIAADGAIIAVISVFTPIEPLRNAEAAFFHTIITQPNPAIQITACIALTAALWAINKTVLAHRRI